MSSIVGPFLSLFSVEVLDTRLEPQNDKRKNEIIKLAGPSRWRSREFMVYAVIFAISVPLMFKAAIDASSSLNPNYEKYKHLLDKGWMFGMLVDNSDAQFSSFRNNFMPLVGIIAVHTLLRRLSQSSGAKLSKTGFDIAFAVLFLLVIHGVNTIKVLFLLWLNYKIAKAMNGQKNAKLVVWTYGIVLLFTNELCRGYPLAVLHPSLEAIDNLSGLMPRWDVHFNFSMLRMVSFSVDYFDSADKGDSLDKPLEKLSERERIETSLPLDAYSLQNYLAYVTYTPLYIAGPILSFNDFYRQTLHPLPSINFDRIFKYTLRLAFCVLTMETVLHFTNVVAISQTRAWEGDSPFEVSMIALFNLNVIWLKLLIPWRLFRLWGLIDGIDSPENMIRCVDNNYSALSFWRSWHRSYNRWLIRYLYVPLGGSKRPILNSLVAFTFVAIWHDIQLHLLMWGWMVVIFILPEVAFSMFLPSKKYGQYQWYRHLCALGAVANIWMMMIANLVGFCVGTDGIWKMLTDMTSTADGLKYIIVSTFCLFVGAQAMFEFREREKRKGIDLRC